MDIAWLIYLGPVLRPLGDTHTLKKLRQRTFLPTSHTDVQVHTLIHPYTNIYTQTHTNMYTQTSQTHTFFHSLSHQGMTCGIKDMPPSVSSCSPCMPTHILLLFCFVFVFLFLLWHLSPRSLSMSKLRPLTTLLDKDMP